MAQAQESVHDFTMTAIDGTSTKLSDFKGKKILIVNTASECGFTPQYEDLQMLHENYGDKIAVLGFPANNFGGQEPGSNDQIASFCKKNYGVTFPMFEKIEVVGSKAHPLYQWLSDKTGKQPTWNFCKYLIDEEGQVVGFYASGVNPMEETITNQL